MKTKFLLSIMVFGVLVLTGITSCGDDDEAVNPVVKDSVYVGSWKSKVYIPTVGDTTKYEQMAFDLTNTNVTGTVFKSADLLSQTVAEASAMKGTIVAQGDTALNVSVTDISVLTTPFTNITDDPDGFNSKWGLSLGQLLNTNFVAKYMVFEGDSMQLALTSKYGFPLTLMLYKQ